MLETSPYPLLTLKLLGTVCPCLEKSDDGPARRAAWSISSVPIRWQRRLRGASGGQGSAAGTASAIGGFISGMFGSSTSTGGEGEAPGGGGDSYQPLDTATLSVVDAPSGPQLVAAPSSRMSSISKKCIPLKLIKKVQARKVGGIISLGSRSGIAILDHANREILRFDVLKKSASIVPQHSSSNGEHDTEREEDDEWENEHGRSVSGEAAVEDAEESARDDIVDQLQLLVEWERRRRAYIVTLGEGDGDENNEEEEVYVDEYDDDIEAGESGTPASPRGGRKKGVLAEKAQQMKHFAQREIEMQKTKKERENRKAKYLKEAGGLKYTAIAMANRS